MDINSKELVGRLQTQIDEMIFRLQAMSANLKMLAGLNIRRTVMMGDSFPDGEKSIHEKEIICLECGKVCRVLTRRHLASHGLNAHLYRKKWGLKSDMPLMCGDLLRAKRERMQTMKLWERRHDLQIKKKEENT